MVRSESEALVSRPWAENRLAEWFHDGDAAPMMMIRGDPGSGKSSLLQQFGEAVPEERLLATISRAGDESDAFDSLSLLRSVIDSLTRLGVTARESIPMPQPGNVTVNMNVGEVNSGEAAGYVALMELTTAGGLLPVAERLVRAVPTDWRPLILIDAVDQAEDEDAVEFLEVTASLVRAAKGSGVRFLCASRRELPLVFDESCATNFNLTADAPKNGDLERYLTARFGHLEPSAQNRVVKAILGGADDNWLWAATNADSLESRIAEEGAVPEKIQMTAGLEGLYKDGVRRMRQRLGPSWASLGRQLLTAVSCALDEHLTITELRWITRADPVQIEDTARDCEPFLRRTKDGVRLFHPDFARWILADNVDGVTEEGGHLAVAQGFTELGRSAEWNSTATNAASRVIEHWCALLVLDPFSPSLQEHEEELGRILMDPGWVEQAGIGLDAIEQAALLAPTLRFPRTNLPLGTGLRVLQDSLTARLLVGREIASNFPAEKLDEFTELAKTPALGVRWLDREVQDHASVMMKTLWGRVVENRVTVARNDGELKAFVSAEFMLDSLSELDASKVNWLIHLTSELDVEQLDVLLEQLKEKVEGGDAEGRALRSSFLGGAHRVRAQRWATDDQRREVDYRLALDANREALVATPPEDELRLLFVIRVANGLRDLKQRTEEQLDELIDVQGELVVLRQTAEDGDWKHSSMLLADAYLERAARAEGEARNADMSLALEAYRKSVDSAKDGNDPRLLSFLVNLAGALLTLDVRSPAELDELVEVQDLILELRRSAGDPGWPQQINLLGAAYKERSELAERSSEERVEDMTRSLAAYREALAATPMGDSNRLFFAADLANCLLDLEDRSDDQLDELVEAQLEVCRLRREVEAEHLPGSLNFLGRAYKERGERADDPRERDTDLRRALAAHSEAFDTLDDDSEYRLAFAIDFANSLISVDRSDEELDRLIEVQREILDLHRKADGDWVPACFILGRALRERALRQDDAQARDENLRSAIRSLREAAAFGSPDKELQAQILIELSGALLDQHSHSDEELDELIATRQKTVELLAERGGDEWAVALNLLARAYQARSERGDDGEKGADLQLSVRGFRDALGRAPRGNRYRIAFAIDLANALRRVSERSREELNELISVQEELLKHYWQAGDPSWARAANVLGDAYRERSTLELGKVDPDSDDYRRAIVAYREAVLGTPANSQQKLVYLSDLSNALFGLEQRTDGELEELIAVQIELVRLRREADEEQWPLSANLLGDAYHERAERRGEELEPQIDDLLLAQNAYREALQAASKDSEHRLSFVVDLANTLRELKSRRSLSQTDELVEAQSELVELRRAADEPDWAKSSNLLGDAYAERATQRDDDVARAADLTLALKAYRDALETIAADDNQRLIFAIDVANTLVLRAIAAKDGGSRTVEEATSIVAGEVDHTRDAPEFTRLLPVLRVAFRRRDRWQA
jgi:hypothetical protein